MKDLTRKKAESIYNNYLNGNLRDFRQEIKKLSKRNIFTFLYAVREDYGQTEANKIIDYCSRLDEKLEP